MRPAICLAQPIPRDAPTPITPAAPTITVIRILVKYAFIWITSRRFWTRRCTFGKLRVSRDHKRAVFINPVHGGDLLAFKFRLLSVINSSIHIDRDCEPSSLKVSTEIKAGKPVQGGRTPVGYLYPVDREWALLGRVTDRHDDLPYLLI